MLIMGESLLIVPDVTKAQNSLLCFRFRKRAKVITQLHHRFILLVEDHEDTNRSLTILLRQRGYQVDPAYDLRTALDLAATREFDVLISDIGLPDGSGIDLMSRLHRRGPLFGIALTGFGMEEDIRRSYDVGFSYHLVKPVDLNKLDSLIQQGAPDHSRVAG